jgi:hypothetical protein
MGRRNPKLLKLRKQRRNALPPNRVDNEIDAAIFNDKPHRPLKENWFHKKGRKESFDVRNEIHGGSYAMARKGKGALLEHPYIRDERVRNRQLRFAGRQINGHNFQEKIEVHMRPDVTSLFCMYCSKDRSVQIFYAPNTPQDPNHRIIEVTKLGVKRSLGYADKDRAEYMLTEGLIKWLKD